MSSRGDAARTVLLKRDTAVRTCNVDVCERGFKFRSHVDLGCKLHSWHRRDEVSPKPGCCSYLVTGFSCGAPILSAEGLEYDDHFNLL
jgi:hypothetical protein